MKRKGLALLLTFCMLAAGAAGCGQTAADSSGAVSYTHLWPGSGGGLVCVNFGRRSPGVPGEVNQIGHLFSCPCLGMGRGGRK